MPEGRTQSDANMMIRPDKMEQYQEIEGEFKIERGFAGMDKAQAFQVCNPHKPRGADFYQYTVFGVDRLGRFEIFRRYSDFAVLRDLFVDRFPGMYVPPLPPKQTLGTNKIEFIEERCFLLNMFIR